jgi:hypothetical protein
VCFERLLATHEAAMVLEVIMCQRLCKCFSNLVTSGNGQDLDEAFPDMFTEQVMVAHVDVLGSRSQLGQSS